MNQFIIDNKLKWFPYVIFENIEYIDKGRSTYKATYGNMEIVLKCFNYPKKSNKNLSEFLNKWKIINSNELIKIYGFTKNTDTLDYMLVMEYANKGNLRGCLSQINDNWKQKLYMLYKIIVGLNNIHEKGLIHYDFHDGNILCINYTDVYGVYISDYLGSYQSANSSLKQDKIYGVVPFIAPEVLRGMPHTQASDIYSFSMIMWEFTSGIPPFNNRAHNLQLSSSICKGERPKIINNTPQCYVDLMKKCWDEDPLNRPSALEVINTFKQWIFFPFNMKIENINGKLKNNIMQFINIPTGYGGFITKSFNNLITKSYYSQECHTSRLLNFTSEELNEILGVSQQELKLFRLKQKKEDAEQQLFKLENIAETYYQSTQNELRMMCLEYEKIKSELMKSQQRNFQIEQDYQNLRLGSAVQIREFAEKENALQTQIACLQNEKQNLAERAGNLTEQIKQNEQINQQVRDQILQLKQEKINLQEKLAKTETIIQGLKFQLTQSQINYQQIEKEKIFKNNMLYDLMKLTNREKDEKAELKAKLEKEIAQLEQKLYNEEQIKVQLTQAIQIKEVKIKELEEKLINLDQEHTKQLMLDKGKELIEIKKDLVNKLANGENTKEIHKEKEAKQREMNEINQKSTKHSASCNNNNKKQILNKANKFLKAKDEFLSLREEVIRNLQRCCNQLEGKGRQIRNEVIGDGVASLGNAIPVAGKAVSFIGDMVIVGSKISKTNFSNKCTKEFQNILVINNEAGLYDMDQYYNSLMNMVQKNKELEVSLKINEILKLNSFDLDKYKIFKIATNCWEGTRAHLDSSLMVEDINSLKKNLDKLRSELSQQKKGLKNLATAD
ncbi:hypothetical protein RclHR1_13400005 [Rhizophagus clarus]|uniref:Kinase-like domain-containing protein n=1 Tax=Rhizophagus clarus TaxID=94130 RepID=A0A2Z6QPW3_9GLOM|nr:hypothetical protein RclHR1_13400005 [Rhizophagus clarus]GES90230.1 kinase-like domain-containing protein [Rhizophagus clarus]